MSPLTLRNSDAGSADIKVYRAFDGWYWTWLDAKEQPVGDPVGPFKTAMAAGESARAELIKSVEGRTQ